MKIRSSLLCGAAIALGWSMSPAFAQDVPAQDEAGGGGAAGALAQEIVVTATKKVGPESTQKVGFAVTALGAAQLEAKQINNLMNLSYDVPNVQLDTNGNVAGYANFSIRGLGVNSSIPSIEPTVGTFVDGIYYGINAGVLTDNFDLEGVEILRGPQGLLFGKNVTGGAVVLRTTKPSNEFKANGRVAVETGLNAIASGTVTGPVVKDVLAAKLAVYYSHDDGWFVNKYDNSKFGKDKQLIIRPAVTLMPGGAIETTLRYEHGLSKGDGAAGQNFALYDRGTFDFAINFPGYHDNRWDQLIAETTIDTAFGNGTVTNIAGFRAFTSEAGSDIDSTPQTYFHYTAFTKQSQLSDELRYAGTFGNVDLTTGLYYFEQKLFYIENRALSGDRNVAGGGVQQQWTFGAFSSIDWHFTDAFTLNLGARWTYEDKDVRVSSIRTDGCSLAARTCDYNFTDKHHWTSFTPKVGVQWKPNGETQVYTFYTRGFRSGGYNFRSTDPGVAPGPFDQEKQDSFELGWKQNFGGGTRFSIAGFYNKLKDLQREINLPGPLGVSQVIRNTADADVRGIEAEGQIAITPRLFLAGNVGYVDGKYVKVIYDLNGDGVIDNADKALNLPRLAPWTYGASLTYDQPLGDTLTATARVEFNHRDRSAYTDNNVGYLQGADMVNASLSLATDGNRWKLAVYGRNLLNEATVGADTKLPAAFGGVGASYSPLNKGRVLGAELTFRY